MLNAFRIGFLAFCLVFSLQVKAQDSTFLSALEDVPLMEGLREAGDETVYFDTPAGRIVEAYAVGEVAKDAVLTYYKDSLPALGWIRNAHGKYQREGETLSITVKMNGKNASVRFALSPDGK